MYKIVELPIKQFYPIKKFALVLVVMMLVILLSSNETASSFPGGTSRFATRRTGFYSVKCGIPLFS